MVSWLAYISNQQSTKTYSNSNYLNYLPPVSFCFWNFSQLILFQVNLFQYNVQLKLHWEWTIKVNIALLCFFLLFFVSFSPVKTRRMCVYVSGKNYAQTQSAVAYCWRWQFKCIDSTYVCDNTDEIAVKLALRDLQIENNDSNIPIPLCTLCVHVCMFVYCISESTERLNEHENMHDCAINVNKQVQESLKNINLQLILIPHIGRHAQCDYWTEFKHLKQ